MSKLCLTCRDNEVIVLDGGRVLITVDIPGKKKGRIKLHFDAPKSVIIDRSPVHERRQEAEVSPDQ